MTERNAPRPLAVLLCALAAAIFAFMVWPGTNGPNAYGDLPNRPKD